MSEYFPKKKQNCRFRLTCTSITSRKLHLKLAGLQTPCKSLTQNQSSALIAYPSLFLTILKRTTVATTSTLRQPGSIQQLYITPHNLLVIPVPLFIANIFLSVKNRFRRSNLQKNEKYQRFFVLKPREYRSFRRSIEGLSKEDGLMVMTTDQLL